MRLELRWFALLLAVATLACSDAGQSPAPVVARGKASLSLAPVFAPSAAAIYAERSTFPGLNFDHVRVAIVRPPLDTVADTTVVFTPSSPDLTLDLTVELTAPDEIFSGVIQYFNSAGVVFEGRFDKLLAHAPGQPPPQQPPVIVSYVGPGFNAARLVVSPKSTFVTAPGHPTFSATAFDAANAPIPNVPIAWTSSDLSLATISDQGVLTPTGKRGTVTITARTPTNLTDNATAGITPPIGGIALLSGGGQAGRVGGVLPVPATVRVTATDGVAVGGASVVFAAPGGGKVGTNVVTTDSVGAASSTLTLGSTAGTQTFAASAAGFTVSISEIATPGDPAAITAVSGGGQSDTVKHALKNPFVARVTDTFGNGLAGITVNWTRTAGSGQLTSPFSITDTSGLASVGYTLGDSVGSESVSASTSGVASSATFTVQAFQAQCTVTLAVNPANGGTVSGGGVFACGSLVTLKATPAPGYVFANWTDSTGVVSTSQSVSLIAANRTLTANFAIAFTITLAAVPAAGGTVSGGGTYAANSTVTARATSNLGYAFSEWRDGGGALLSSNPVYSFVVTRDAVLNGYFKPAPILSNLQVKPDSLGAGCGNGAAPVDYTFAYSDAGGNVLSSSYITLVYSFQPSGRAASTTLPYGYFTGTPTAGTGFVTNCPLFGTDTQVTTSFTLVNSAGLSSNTLTNVYPRPAGAP